MTVPGRVSGSAVACAVVVWAIVAFAAGATGLMRSLYPPSPQVLILVLAVATVVALTLPIRVRAWTERVDLRVFLLPHLARFVGIYFLVLYGRGELPYDFAVPFGWGDIAVAVGAVLLLLSGTPRTSGHRLAFLIWNTLGLADILGIVATAAPIGLHNPDALAPLLRLPLALLPTFLVPLVIATHAVVYVRLARSARPAIVN